MKANKKSITRVCTTPEMIEADKPMMDCRVAPKADNLKEAKITPEGLGR